MSTSSPAALESARSEIKVLPLRSSVRSEVDRFVAAPRSPGIAALYAPYRDVWCPYTDDTLRRTLSPENPIYEHTESQLFVATRDGRDCGRVAAFYNPLSSLAIERKLGFFGYFEAADQDTARALLLEAAWPWLKGRGAAGMVGNINPTTNDEIGVLVEGFHRHILLLVFNPPQYPAFLEALGFRKAMDVYAFLSPLKLEAFTGILGSRPTMEKAQRAADIMAKRAGVTLEYLSKRNVASFAHEFCAVYNRAWRDHWGYEPFTSPELLYLSSELLLLLPREFIIFARNKEGEMVGASLTAPDLNELFRWFDGRMGLREQLAAAATMLLPGWVPLKHRPGGLRIIGLGVLPEYARQGAGAALMVQTVVNGMKLGFKELSMSWILEDNAQMLEIPRRNLGLQPDQTWRLFEYRPG